MTHGLTRSPLLMLLAACCMTQSGGSAEAGLTPRQTEAGIELSVRAPGARHLTVAGSFNGWSSGRTELADADGDGVWTVCLKLPPGRHEYLLMLDGQAPHRGSRIDRESSRALQSHQPLDMALHWLVPINVLRIGSDGQLIRQSLDPVTFRMLDAARIQFSLPGGVDEEAYRGALATLEEALALAPRNAWLQRQRLQLTTRFELEADTAAVARARIERDLESRLRPLLNSPWLSENERHRCREALRRWLSQPDPQGSLRALAQLSERVRGRDTAAGLLRQIAAPGPAPVAGTEDWGRTYKLLSELSHGYALSDPAGFARWQRHLRKPMFASPEALPAEQFSDLRHVLSKPGGAAPGLPAMAEWLTRNGLASGPIITNFSLLPRTKEVEYALELLRLLANRPALQRDVLFWILTFSSKIRDTPEATELLSRHLASETDRLIATRLAGRLAYSHMVAHREPELYAMLRRRLTEDPTDIELPAMFEAFLGSLRALEREFAGLIANPWQEGLREQLVAMELLAPNNPVIARMTALELSRGRPADTEARLRLLLARHPGWAETSLELAGMLESRGDLAGARAVMLAAWRARQGSALLGLAVGRLLGRDSANVPAMSSFLEGPFHSDAVATLAYSGVVGGLRDTLGAAAARRLLAAYSPKGALEARLLRRALLRLALELGAVDTPIEPDTVELRYAALAARVWGRTALSEELLERTLSRPPVRRLWLLDALTAGSDRLADRAAELALAAELLPGSPVPFVAHQARRALAAGNFEVALSLLDRLEPDALLPEQRRGILAGRFLCDAATGRPADALRVTLSLFRLDLGTLLYGLVALLLPAVLAAGLAVRGSDSR